MAVEASMAVAYNAYRAAYKNQTAATRMDSANIADRLALW